MTKLARNFITHFVTTDSDTWSDGGDHVTRLGTEVGVHFLKRTLNDMRCRPTPSGMYGGHRGVSGIGQKYRVAVGSADGYRNTGPICH